MLTLEEFVFCQNQWENNRMTRHLADMSIIECDKSLSIGQKNHLMLESAKINLKLPNVWHHGIYSTNHLFIRENVGNTF
ncbi:unnamed protein product [Gordionus sp. m RMFG-2023]